MTRPQYSLPQFMWADLMKDALAEDLGLGGDVTTSILGLESKTYRGKFVARENGVVCGLAALRETFKLLDGDCRVHCLVHDGQEIAKGETIATVEGAAGAILTGERVALNVLCQLSGIASTTHHVMTSLAGLPTKVAATRKTHPRLRAYEKYAVLMGGGTSHRYRLDDAVLIKDNHIALFGNDIEAVLKTARQNVGHMVKIELEIDTLDQLRRAIDAGGADIYLLDNMDLAQLRKACSMIDGSAVIEASGGIGPDNARQIAQTGVDVISMGWLTQHIQPLDIGLDSV